MHCCSLVMSVQHLTRVFVFFFNTSVHNRKKTQIYPYNDPPLELREAIPDRNVGNVSDEEDPLTANLHSLDVEFNNGLESPLTWIFGDCH